MPRDSGITGNDRYQSPHGVGSGSCRNALVIVQPDTVMRWHPVAFVFSEPHLRRILAEYFDYYHRSRTNVSLAKDSPEQREVDPTVAAPSTLCPLQFVLAVLSGWMNDHQARVVDYLREENRLLKQQLGGRRLRLSDDVRRRLAAKAVVLGRKLLSLRSQPSSRPKPSSVDIASWSGMSCPQSPG
jgi:hypothetical protein